MLKYNRNYFVPVVVKNRDRLIGFLDSFVAMMECGISMDDIIWPLDSTRFSDILPSGNRASEISDEELDSEIKRQFSKKEIKEIVPGSKPIEDSRRVVEIEGEKIEFLDLSKVKYLELNCSCGNYYSFNGPENIPVRSLHCDLCGKVLIDYTHKEDEEFIYDGVLEDVDDDDDDDEKE